MKITKTQLRRVIREEISKVISEDYEDYDPFDPSNIDIKHTPSQYDRLDMYDRGVYDANKGNEPQNKGDVRYMRGYQTALYDKARRR
jgi:hypothetical protein